MCRKIRVWEEGKKNQRAMRIIAFGHHHDTRGSLRRRRAGNPAAQFWVDVAGRFGMPLVRVDESVRLVHHQGSKQKGAWLEINFPHPQISSDDDNAWAGFPPDYTQLVGREVLWIEGQWHNLEDPSSQAKTKTVHYSKNSPLAALRQKAHLPSDEENLLTRINLIWASCSVILLVGIAIYWWRRPRNKDDVHVSSVEEHSG